MLDESPANVRLAVYFEALCYDSVNFFKNQLLPTYELVGDIIDLELIPFGKASVSICWIHSFSEIFIIRIKRLQTLSCWVNFEFAKEIIQKGIDNALSKKELLIYPYAPWFFSFYIAYRIHAHLYYAFPIPC